MDKAQVFSLDIAIAAGIFILILVSTATLWNYTNEKIPVEESRNDMERIARNALAVLIETGGSPSNWTAQPFSQTDIQSIGLANSFLELDQTKMSALSAANYSTTKILLGILGSGYEFALDITVWNGTTYETNYTIGLQPNATASEVVRAERFALTEDIWTKVSIRVWKSCGDITC